MAGEWIKVERATPDKPEVMRMARILGIDKDEAFGKLIRFWAWLDGVSVDGVVDGVVSTDVDAVVFQRGFTKALSAVGWCNYDDDAETLVVTNFDLHNGETAKKRAMKNRRQSNWRKGLRDVEQEALQENQAGNNQKNVDASVDGAASTSASTREEKRREDKNNKELSINKKTFIDTKKEDGRVVEDKEANKKQRVSTSLVEQIFEDWKSVLAHPGSKLGKKRGDVIREAVRTGYTPEQMHQSFLGCARSYFHQGFNEQQKKYTDIELILRNEKNIDKFILYSRTPPKPQWKPEDNTLLGLRRQATEFYEAACLDAQRQINITGTGTTIDAESWEILQPKLAH